MTGRAVDARWARWASLLLAVAGGVVVWSIDWRLHDCMNAHRAISIASTPQRITEATASCNATTGELRASLWWDCLAAITYAAGLGWALWSWWPKGWPSRRQNSPTIRKAMLAVPLAAGAFDLVENAIALCTVRVECHHVAVGRSAAAALATVGVAKWGLAILAVVALILTLYGAIRFRSIDFAPSPAAAPTPGTTPPGGSAVCLSGGGIRSAAFSWGALAALEERKIFTELDEMYSVSGGGYTATSWSTRRDAPATAGTPWFTTPQQGADAAPYEYVYANRRYLDNLRGGLGWALLRTVCSLVLNLAVITAGLVVIAVPLGALARSTFGPVAATGSGKDFGGGVREGWWIPIVGQVVIATALAAVSLLIAHNRRRRQVLLGAAGFLGLGAAYLVLLVVIPILAFQLKQLMGGDLLKLALPAVVSWAAGIVLTLLRSAVTKNLLRLGGVLSTAAMFIGVLAIVRKILESNLGSTDAALLVLGALAFLVMLDNTGVQWWSMHPLYRDRLAGTFSLRRESVEAAEGPPTVRITPQRASEWRTWTAEDWPAGPEHIVCAATHRRDKSVTGLRAISFTFSRQGIAMHVPRLQDGRVVVDSHRRDAAWFERAMAKGVNRHFTSANRRTSVIGTAAMSGAAFNSAMGRHSKGSTDSLLAVLNLRLGVWLPNPRFDTHARRRFPRAGLRYLFHEVIGYYDIDDPFVQVSDGGHWENLGLVEALRARRSTIIVVDASGGRVDPASVPDPEGFQELFEAIDVARIELGTEVRIKVDSVRPSAQHGRCFQNWVTGTIVYHSDRTHDWRDCHCPEGTVVYIKAMVSDRTPEDVLAFANIDRVFPDYPTGDQFLSEEQFDALVRLGHSAMSAAVERSGAFTAWGVEPPPG